MTYVSTLHWTCTSTAAGQVREPAALPADSTWIPASVPGTAASAVFDHSGRSAVAAIDFDKDDWWFVGTTDEPIEGPGVLELDGIATLFDVWIDGNHVLRGESMFAPTAVEFDGLRTVAIRCSSVAKALEKRRPRGRWRSSLVAQQGLRWIRTSLLGRADLFAGVPSPVGPWRDVRITRERRPVLRTRLEGTTGVLEIDTVLPESSIGGVLSIEVADRSVDFEITTRHFTNEIRLNDVRKWWPHTHGDPHLYEVRLRYGARDFQRGWVGFRQVEVDRTEGAFALSLNGTRVFCRGACWVPPNPVSLNASVEELRKILDQVRGAGMNMVRVTGTMTYEGAEFWELCARMGIMVWQDVMLATFDPPDAEDFTRALYSEVESLLTPLAANPALVVVSGGSETEQQPAMLGLSVEARAMQVLDSVIPRAVRDVAPTVVHVSSSPSGPPGTSPFDVSVGVAHYFGVGGYLHSLDRVRSAGVRFAAECAAFSIPPERASVERVFGSASKAGHHPEWKKVVPRDRGSSWDFEDVRDYYIRDIFAVDPFEVRRVDPERYLDLGRAAVCEAISALFTFWRRADSQCDGALILTLRDLESGPGWGLIDAQGVPKAPWHSMRRVCAPRAVVISNEGLDGLRVDVFNDSPDPLVAVLRLSTHDVNGNIIDVVRHDIMVDPHRSLSRSTPALWQAFSDVSYAYRFGPQMVEGVTATLETKDGAVISVGATSVGPKALQMQRSVGMTAMAGQDESGWFVDIATRSLARYVVVEVPGFEPSDSWFDLLGGSPRRIRLRADADSPSQVRGRVRALNCYQETPVS